MSRNLVLAWLALVVTVTIWAGFLIATRAAAASSLGPIEVGLMRFGPAALLFSPVILRHGLLPGGATWRQAAVFAGFGGIGFVLCLAGGLAYAPVADSGVFTPAMLPIYVALLSFVLLRERFGRIQILGFGLILAGALAVGGWQAVAGAAPGAWRGHLLFSAASMSWAIYTIAFRRSGLAVLPAAAMLCVWSAFGFILLAFVFGAHFGGASPATLALQTILQGVLSGFVATLTFFYAISRLGAARTASFAALTPILAALGGWLLLGEALTPVVAAGVAVTAAGVALASRPRREALGEDAAHDP